MTSRDTQPDVTAAVAALFVEHDPLEPWLTESHWDADYWTDEATILAERLTPGMNVSEVRSAVLDVLHEALPASPLRADRIDALAQSCWNLLHAPTDR
jgi:hypothetical protein